MRARHRLATDLHGPFKHNFFSSIKKLREARSPPTFGRVAGHMAHRDGLKGFALKQSFPKGGEKKEKEKKIDDSSTPYHSLVSDLACYAN